MQVGRVAVGSQSVVERSGSPEDQTADGSPSPIDIRQVWQFPALLVSLALMTAAVVSLVLSGPKPDYPGMIAQATRLLEQEQYTDALAHLENVVRPFAGQESGMPPDVRRQFHILRARAIAMVQKVHGVDRPENHQRVVTEYTRAEAIEGADGSLEAPDVYRLAMAYIALGKLEKALECAQGLPKEARAQRSEILKRLVEVKLEAPAPDPDSTLAMIGMFLGEEPSPSEKAWALARQAELLIRQGYARQAIDRILPKMAGVITAEPERRGELHYLIARAFHETDGRREAAHQLEVAIGLLPEGDPRHGRALTLLAMIEAERGELESARQRYAQVLEQYADAEVRLPALLGHAEACAAAGDMEASQREYEKLVGAISQGGGHPEITTEAVTRSLMDRSDSRAAAGDAPGTLRFARLALRLQPPAAIPPEILLALARAHRRSADEKLRTPSGESAALVELSHLDPATREEVRADLAAAADFFRRHSAAIVELDNDAFGNSLWLAADSFDRAGDQGEAIPLFQEFAQGFQTDPRRDEARFRLAQAYQARGDYDLAAAHYRELIGESRAGVGGPIADASYVPLARALLANTDQTDNSEAAQLLSDVVEGRVGRAETPEYREALVHLARMDAEAGRYAAAIERLEEAVARFPGEGHSAGLLFELAESYRRDAAEIGRTLQEEMPDSERRDLETTRSARLTRAMGLYQEVRDALAAVDSRRLTDGDALRLRNSHFYMADCAFDLGEFETAIRLYDAARERYPRDPASLVAMIQIVNAYVEQGDLKRAATANERARRFYESLPEEVWADPTLPIGRRDWQRWLDALAVLGGPTAGAGEGAEDPPRR